MKNSTVSKTPVPPSMELPYGSASWPLGLFISVVIQNSRQSLLFLLGKDIIWQTAEQILIHNELPFVPGKQLRTDGTIGPGLKILIKSNGAVALEILNFQYNSPISSAPYRSYFLEIGLFGKMPCSGP